MKTPTSATQQIRFHIESIPANQPFSAATLLPSGSRTSIDQSLSRMVRSGLICRVARGVYIRLENGQHHPGSIAEQLQLLRNITVHKGETIQLCGEQCAIKFGFVAGHTDHTKLWTSGPSRRVTLLGKVFRLRHVPARKLALANQPAGLALAALWFLGKDNAGEQHVHSLQRQLGDAEFHALEQAHPAMPIWMRKLFVNKGSIPPPAAGRRNRQQEEMAVLLKLVDDIYQTALDTHAWSGIAPRLASVFHSNSAVLKVHGPQQHVHLLEVTDNLVVSQSQQSWAEHWHKNDLWVERSTSFGIGRIVTSDDLLGREEIRHSDFYHDWLHKIDIHHMLGMTLALADDTVAVLGIHRSKDRQHYQSQERQKLAILVPHLERALQLRQRLQANAIEQFASYEVMQSLDTAVFVIDAMRHVLFANRRAHQLMTQNAEVAIKRRELHFANMALHKTFAGMLANTIGYRFSPLAQAPSSLAIPRNDRLPLILSLSPLISPLLEPAGTLALVFVTDPEYTPASQDELRSLFGLTPSEAVIAADLCRGKSLPDIALAHRVSIATVRSHLKNLLAKTATTRQAELVVLLKSSHHHFHTSKAPEEKE